MRGGNCHIVIGRPAGNGFLGEENQSSQAHSSQDSMPNLGQKRPRFDPKELAKKRAKEAKDEAKRMSMAKEASTMRSISSFFAKPKK